VRVGRKWWRGGGGTKARGRRRKAPHQDEMDKQTEAALADSISTVGVPMKEYPPSEAYSSEPPPAYVRPRATAVQIARIAAVTLVAVSFILGCFMVASAYITATASCSQYIDYPTSQQDVGEERPSFQHLVDPLESEETSQSKRESVVPPQAPSNNQNEDEPIQIKLPLQLDFDELAGSLIEKNQRSRMNCVVEKRRAEEVMDHQPKTVRLPFGVNLTTDPRYEHITGERMAIFCESGNEQRHVPMDQQQQQQQMTPVLVPIPIHHPVPVPVHFHPGMGPHQRPQGSMAPHPHPNMIPHPHANMAPHPHANIGPHPHANMAPQGHPAQMEARSRFGGHVQQLPPQMRPHHQMPPQMPIALQAQILQELEGSEEGRSTPIQIIEEEHVIPIFSERVAPQGRAFHHPLATEAHTAPLQHLAPAVPADTVKPPPPPPQFHRLPVHIPMHPQPEQQQQESQLRPHYVQPRSVRSVDSVLRRDKRVRRCACDCAC